MKVVELLLVKKLLQTQGMFSFQIMRIPYDFFLFGTSWCSGDAHKDGFEWFSLFFVGETSVPHAYLYSNACKISFPFFLHKSHVDRINTPFNPISTTTSSLVLPFTWRSGLVSISSWAINLYHLRLSAILQKAYSFHGMGSRLDRRTHTSLQLGCCWVEEERHTDAAIDESPSFLESWFDILMWEVPLQKMPHKTFIDGDSICNVFDWTSFLALEKKTRIQCLT